MTAGPQDEGSRLRERALRAAATAYSAAHGHPLEHATSGLRWRTGTLAVVAGAVVLACLVGGVGVRALVGPAPEPTLLATVTPLPDVATDGADDGSGSGEGGGTDVSGPADDGGRPGSGDDGPWTPSDAPVPAAGLLVVHVVGAVETPGLVRLVPGSRVADAVELAGGATSGADLTALNLARPVHDGEQIRVPLPGEEVTDPTLGPAPTDGAWRVDGRDAGGAGGGATRRVDVNRATAGELETLPGIGPVLAQRIVTHRAEHGAFGSVEALAAVSGIGPRVLDGLRDHVVAGAS